MNYLGADTAIVTTRGKVGLLDILYFHNLVKSLELDLDTILKTPALYTSAIADLVNDKVVLANWAKTELSKIPSMPLAIPSGSRPLAMQKFSAAISVYSSLADKLKKVHALAVNQTAGQQPIPPYSLNTALVQPPALFREQYLFPSSAVMEQLSTTHEGTGLITRPYSQTPQTLSWDTDKPGPNTTTVSAPTQKGGVPGWMMLVGGAAAIFLLTR